MFAFLFVCPKQRNKDAKQQHDGRNSHHTY
jgi:hypothetical protein